MQYGFARVSSTTQQTRMQLDALNKAGCERIFEESVSGVAPRAKRPALTKLIAALKPGDVVVVYSMSRLARSVAELTTIFAEVEQRGANVRSLTEPHIDTTSAVGRLTFNIMASLAQFERELTNERAADGRAAARARGVHMGRKPVLTPDQRAGLLRLTASGLSVSEAARVLKVSRATAYRVVQEERSEPA